MAIEFKLPKKITWQGDNATVRRETVDIVSQRFTELADFCREAQQDFDNAIAGMQSSLRPIAVNDVPINTVPVPDLGTDIPTFTETFDKTFTDTPPPPFVKEFLATPPTFDGEFAAVLPTVVATFNAEMPEFLATFTGSIPDLTISHTMPSGEPDMSTMVWEDGTIHLEPELINKLAFWLTSGESAIPQTLGDQIYMAAMTRIDDERLQAITKFESDVAARGFQLPGGALIAQRTMIEREYAKGSADVAAKIAEKNMELTQANFHKASELAAAYVAAAQEHLVKKNLAKFEMYKTLADVWLRKVDASLKKIDAEIAVFNGKIEGVKAAASVYATEAQIYDSKVKGFATQVDKYRTDIGLYEAGVKGYEAQVKKYDADASVFNARMHGFSAEADAYKTQVEAYDALVKAFVSRAQVYKTEAEIFDTKVRAYVGTVQGAAERAKAIAESVRLKMQAFQVEANIGLEKEKLSVQAQTANQALAQKIAEAQSQLHAQLVASGMSAMHVQAGMSASHGDSHGVSWSYSYGEHMNEGHQESISLAEKP